MALYHEDIANIDLENGNIYRSFLSHTIGYGDNDSNRFGIRAFRNGQPETLGGTCAGYFIRADGQTVVIADGVVSGNLAYVTLPEACYAVEGQFSLAIKVSGSGVTGTMRIVDGVVSRTSTSAVVDPGTIIPSVEDLIDAIDDAVASIPADYTGLWTSLAPEFSTETAYTAGQYVTYDGKMYKFTTDHAAGTWNSAHVTQVNVGGETSDVKSALNILSIPVVWRDGKYLDSNGAYQSYSAYQASKKISVRDSSGFLYRNIHIKVMVNSATYIIYYDKDLNIIATETVSTANEKEYETDTMHVSGCYFVSVSNCKTYTPQIWASYVSTDMKYLLDLLPWKWNLFDSNNPGVKTGKFLNDDGTIITLAGYSVSHLIPVVGGISYTYTQPYNAFGSEAHYAVCSPDGTILAVKLPQVSEDSVTFTEPESCYVIVNIYSGGESGFGSFRFCKTADVAKSSSVYNGRLAGKKILYNGDSIAEGRYSGFSANGGAYPKIISEVTGCTFQNRAVGGGTLAVHGTSHNICTDIANMSADGDLICLEGGINDYWGNVPLGTYSQSSFTDEVDNTTICGALEYMFRAAINKWVGKPIVFVIVHKITVTAWNNNSAGYCFADVRQKMIEICQKYSITYLDMWAEGGLNAYMSALDEAYLNGGSNVHPDGCHPDENGYKKYYVPRLIALFESLLPYDE